jgi:hypothetical protein
MAIVGRQFTPWAAWFVVITTTSGRQMEIAFPSRIEAKAFLYKIPFYQSEGGAWTKVRSAMLRHSFLSLN